MDQNAPMTILRLGLLDFTGFCEVSQCKILLYWSNLGFSAFILKVLQCLLKSRRKINSNEIRDYFFCTANARTCMDVMYFVPLSTSAYHLENTRLDQK